MFDPCDGPRLFGVPPGADFAAAIVDRLTTLTAAMAPQDVARIQVFVNTARMRRRLHTLFDAGSALLLPRIRLITDLGQDPSVANLAPAVSPLRRRFEVARFVAALLDQQPDLAPRGALFDLADSLANLMDEMQGEGVSPDDIAALKIEDQSGHWDRALRFLNIITPYFSGGEAGLDAEARQRQVITSLAATWQTGPPHHPVIVAGSTGSRGATRHFMQAVAHLPQGAVVLPGFDFDLPDAAWAALTENTQDHPQYRFRALLDTLDVPPAAVAPWQQARPPNAARNRLISLSLRPAPVTDAWLQDGPALGDLAAATDGLTLLEAPTPRAEAAAIALRLRQAVEDGQTAALITPDRTLTRQVAAAMETWGITPDDSAGVPLHQSPPGRFLRHVIDLSLGRLNGERLLVTLKHPLCQSGAADRGDHLLNTRALELHLRRHGPAFLTAATLTTWADAQTAPDKRAWGHWVANALASVPAPGVLPVGDHMTGLLNTAEIFARGQASDGTGSLWEAAAGREARRICDMVQRDADAAASMTTADFASLFNAILSQSVVRDRDTGHPGVLIWGTLEARVQSADLVILGGLNEGTWPETPALDPWLNRAMRAQVGLLLPERQIGLAAHDYQQAVGGAQVWISRSKRTDEAETVPSRWVNRLTNLLQGLPDQHGPAVLAAMRAEGDRWLTMAAALAAPAGQMDPAPRPAPRPPATARPRDLSVTRIKTLIRDPYAIYAEKVLRLKPLDPLTPTADAPLRGVIFHAILEDFIGTRPVASDPAARALLLAIANTHLDRSCPWPTIRAQWFADLARAAPAFLAAETERQNRGDLTLTEAMGEMDMPMVAMRITCKADRIDLTPDGSALIYDYKTGQIPTTKMQEHFDKQLLVEAVMVERGAFRDLGPTPVAGAAFLAVKADANDVPAPLDKTGTAEIYAGLETLFSHWAQTSTGYTARTAMFTTDQDSLYDHLSRFGEWTMSQAPRLEDLS